MSQLPPPSPGAYLPGLDVVRVAALGLVTAQHALTLTGRDDCTLVAGLSLGQFGVALFLAVSGLLAGQSRHPPAAWLSQRLRKVFPAYWIAVGGSFLIAGLAGHKRFDAYQVFAQLSGIGLFTHRENLINSPTWFVSLVLVCYLATFVARRAGASAASATGATLVLAALVAVGENPWLLSHLLTYSLAFTIALAPRRRAARLAPLVGVALFALAATLQPAFGYAAVALVSVELARRLPRTPRAVAVAAHYSYEYYLVHGVALYGSVRLLPSVPVVAVGLAVASAAAAAVALRWLVDRLEAAATRRKRPPAG